MNIDGLIVALLQEKKNLIVPGFGSFIKSGSDESYTIIFNEFLKFNDKVLQNYTADEADISPAEALTQIENYTNGVKETLNNAGEYIIPGLGILKNTSGKLSFQYQSTISTDAPTIAAPIPESIQESVVDPVEEPVKETSNEPIEESVNETETVSFEETPLPEPIETAADQLPEDEYQELMEQSSEVEEDEIDTFEEAQAEVVASTIIEEKTQVYSDFIDPDELLASTETIDLPTAEEIDAEEEEEEEEEKRLPLHLSQS